MTSDWEPDAEEGGTVWLEGKVHKLIDEQKFDDESPNQFLKRKLGDEEDIREVQEERFREIAQEEIEKEKRRSRA